MDKNFHRVMDALDRFEGGYVNHPRDPGGETNKGVTKRVYDSYRAAQGQPPRSVRQLTNEEWREIFWRQYWLQIAGPRLPDGVDMAVMDGAVHSGIYQSGKWLQRALGEHYKGAIDGHIGEGTIAALEAHPDHDGVIADYLARRLGMLQNLKTWGDFGKGWSARIASVRAIAQAWAMGTVGPVPVNAAALGGSKKAYASDVEEAPLPEEAATQAQVGGGSLAVIVQAGAAKLSPYVGTSDIVDYIVLALTIAGIAITIIGAAYGFWASRKNARARRAIDGDVVATLPSYNDAVAAASMP